MAQYFIEVVPTEFYSFLSTIKTYQYSVKENTRPISEYTYEWFLNYNLFLMLTDLPLPQDHDKGSHGIPGLYFKYDMSALKVIIRQDRENFVHFIIRLCSVIAGIIVISGVCSANKIAYLHNILYIFVFLKDSTQQHLFFAQAS